METFSLRRGTITYVRLRPSLIAALVFLSACSKSPAASTTSANEVLLELGQRAVLTGDIGVRFTKVVEDSRCPANVVCIWEGNARVELTFDGPEADSLNTNGSSGPRSLTHKYLRLELVNLEPYPGTGSTDPLRVRLRWGYLPD